MISINSTTTYIFEFVYQKLNVVLKIKNYLVFMRLNFCRDLRALALQEHLAKAPKGQARVRCQTLAPSLQNPNHRPQQERAQLNPDQAPGKGVPLALVARRAKVPLQIVKGPPLHLPGVVQQERRK